MPFFDGFFRLGLLVVLVGIAVAIFTSNVFISSEERRLNQLYVSALQSGGAPTSEMKHAHLNFLVVRTCRWAMLFGVALMAIDFLS